MRIIRHWWPNCRKYTAYELHIALHWYGFTTVIAWRKSTGVISPIFRENKGNEKGVTPVDLYPRDMD